MVLYTFNQENHDRILKRYGEEQGRQNLLKDLILKKLDKGKSVEQIADELEQDIEIIQKIIEEFSN